MSESTHPSAVALEGWYAERAPAEVGDHVGGCEQCQTYIQQLEEARAAFLKDEPAAAFLRRPAIGAELNRPAATPRVRWWLALLPALAAAALVAFFMRPPGLPIEVPYTDTPDVIRFMGSTRISVALKRGGVQTTMSGALELRPADAFRVRLTLAEPGKVTVGVLEENGTWTPLLDAVELPAGQHWATDEALIVDNSPTSGWILAGAPAKVRAARTSPKLAGVTVMRLTWAGPR